MKTREEALKYGLSFPDTFQDAPFHDRNWSGIKAIRRRSCGRMKRMDISI